MRKININSIDLSFLIWNKILENSNIKRIVYKNEFFKIIDKLDELRAQSSYNTGSISSTSAWLLFSLCFYFKPQTILEVGSFIGKSTFSMALAADHYSNERNCEIFCCDHSNEINFPKLTNTKINQFHKTNSTDMFEKMNKDLKFDFIHLDGGLQKKDFLPLKQIISDNTIFIFDDFEGSEKGVLNFINLLNNNVISRNTHCLVYPIQKQVAQEYSLNEPSSTAVVLPVSSMTITRQ